MEFNYKNTVYFHVPIYFEIGIFERINYIYHALLDTNINRGDIKLIGYGCPNNCIWNGGRLIMGQQYDIETLEMIISFYKSFLSDIQFTFTNFLLEENDVYDRYGNALLDLANRYDIEILICSDILEKYIRDKYPNIRIARSIINDATITTEDLDKYSTIVVSKYKNKDIPYLKALSSFTTHNLFELLVDEQCGIDCPRRARDHYEAYNKSQLYIKNDLCKMCTAKDKSSYKQIEILPEEINDYLDINYNRFKLSGREKAPLFIESAIRYMIQEEHQQNVRMNAYTSMAELINEQVKNQMMRNH